MEALKKFIRILVFFAGIIFIVFGLLLIASVPGIDGWVVLIVGILLIFYGKSALKKQPKLMYIERPTQNTAFHNTFRFPKEQEEYELKYEYYDITYKRRKNATVYGVGRIMVKDDKAFLIPTDSMEIQGEIYGDKVQMILDYMNRKDTVAAYVINDKILGLGFYKKSPYSREVGKLDENKQFIHDSAGEIPPVEFADKLNGVEFEQYCAAILDKLGYTNISLTARTGDKGIDIIAYRMKRKIVFQCKRYESNVGNKAIQEAYSGVRSYMASEGVVITNSHFTKQAIEDAEDLKISLWDREKLEDMVMRAND